jgi:hypothetical protein
MRACNGGSSLQAILCEIYRYCPTESSSVKTTTAAKPLGYTALDLKFCIKYEKILDWIL